jgi:hypothetical protein
MIERPARAAGPLRATGCYTLYHRYYGLCRQRRDQGKRPGHRCPRIAPPNQILRTKDEITLNVNPGLPSAELALPAAKGPRYSEWLMTG